MFGPITRKKNDNTRLCFLKVYFILKKKFTSSPKKMAKFANSRVISILMWVLGIIVIAANVYLVYDVFFDVNNGVVMKIANQGLKIFLIIVIVICGILYFLALAYLIYLPVGN